MSRLRKRNKFQRGGRPFVPSVGVRSVAGQTQQNLQVRTPDALNTRPFFAGLAARDRRDAFNEAVFQDRRDTRLDFIKTFIPDISGIDSNSYDLTTAQGMRLAQEDATHKADIIRDLLAMGYNGGGLQGAGELMSKEILRQNTGERLLHKSYNELKKAYKGSIETASQGDDIVNYALADKVRTASELYQKNLDQTSLKAYSDAVDKYNKLPSIPKEAAKKARERIINLIGDPTAAAKYLGSVGGFPELVGEINNTKVVGPEAIKVMIKADAVSNSVFQGEAATKGVAYDSYIDEFIKAYSVPTFTDKEKEAINKSLFADREDQNETARNIIENNAASANRIAEEELKSTNKTNFENLKNSNSASATSSNTTRVGNFNIPNDVIESLDAPASVVSKALSEYNQAISEGKTQAQAEALILQRYPALTADNGQLSDDFFNVKSVSTSTASTNRTSPKPLSFDNSGVDQSFISGFEQSSVGQGESSLDNRTGIYSVREEFKVDSDGQYVLKKDADGEDRRVSKGKSYGSKQFFGKNFNGFVDFLDSNLGLNLSPEQKKQLRAQEAGNEGNILNFIQGIANDIGDAEFRRLEDQYGFETLQKPAIEHAESVFGPLSNEVRTFVADSANQHDAVKSQVIDKASEILKENTQLDPNSQKDILLALSQARADYLADGAGGSITRELGDELINSRVNPATERLVNSLENRQATSSTASSGAANSAQSSSTNIGKYDFLPSLSNTNNTSGGTSQSTAQTPQPTQQTQEQAINSQITTIDSEIDSVSKLPTTDDFGRPTNQDIKIRVNALEAEKDSLVQQRSATRKAQADEESKMEAIADAVESADGTKFKGGLGISPEILRSKKDSNVYLVSFRGNDLIKGTKEEVINYLIANFTLR